MKFVLVIGTISNGKLSLFYQISRQLGGRLLSPGVKGGFSPFLVPLRRSFHFGAVWISQFSWGMVRSGLLGQSSVMGMILVFSLEIECEY